MTLKRQHLSALTPLPPGWTVENSQQAVPHSSSTTTRYSDGCAVAHYSRKNGIVPEPLILIIRGRNALLFGEATPACGKYRVRVDGGEPMLHDAGAMAKNGALRFVQMIAQDLQPGTEHRIEIYPDLKPGQELRLESICMAIGGADDLPPVLQYPH